MNYVKLAEQTVKSHRKKKGKPPEDMPIFWKGIRMSVDETCAVILVLEKEKAKYLKRYRNTESGSRITKIAFDSTGEALGATAKGLKIHPLTAIAGFVVGGAESSLKTMGEIISTGISETGKHSNLSLIEELVKEIEHLQNLITEHHPQP